MIKKYKYFRPIYPIHCQSTESLESFEKRFTAKLIKPESKEVEKKQIA